MAETRFDAHKAFDRTLKRFEAKYPKAMACLAKDRDERKRSSNPIFLS